MTQLRHGLSGLTHPDVFSFRLPQNPGLTPVGYKTSQKLNTAFGRLGLALESGVSKECQEKVLDQIALTGLNVSAFIAFLDRGANFYSGEKSTATVAGNVGTLAWSNAAYGKGATVSGVFSSNPGTMALSSFVNTTLTVFFREGYVNQMNEDRLQAFIFHEALNSRGVLMVHTDPLLCFTHRCSRYTNTLGVTFFTDGWGTRLSRGRQFGSQGVGFYIHFTCGVLQQG